MLVDQDSPKSENEVFIYKSLLDPSSKLITDDDKGIEIDSVESLYCYGRSVVRSNLEYMFTYFDGSPTNQLTSAVCIRHGNLLTQTKVAVKRVMEEAATRKLLYFNNSTVNGLCVAVESCLLDGLQRRLISLFDESHSLALLKKISKDCEAASFLLGKINNFTDYSAPYSATHNGRFFNDNDSIQKSPNSISLPNTISGLFNKSKPSTMKYLWIKLAMVEKILVPIIKHIMQHHQQYYDDSSLMSSYLSASLFLELIAGPCSLDFSLVKPSEHIWNDPDALELLDRHKIHSINSWPTVEGKNIYQSGIHLTRSIKNRPYLKIQHHSSPLQMQESKFNQAMANVFNMNTPQSGTGSNGTNAVAKDYVESLHQNLKHVLLYGKNNVVVQPKEDLNEMQGYLSLHLIPGDRLRLNWTPNQLMNNQISQGSVDPYNGETPQLISPQQLNSHAHDSPHSMHTKLLQWDSALCIKLENIVYLHCHNHEEHGGKVTLVCQDGVQHPPLNFPPGGHLLQFLTCLENGLLPSGHLDPPLLQLNDADKTFPKRYRRQSTESSVPSDSSEHSKSKASLAQSFLSNFNRSIRRQKDISVEEEHLCSLEDVDGTNCDYVFKIVYVSKHLSGNSSCESSHGAPNSAGDPSKDEKGHFPWNSQDSVNHSDTNVSSIDTLCVVMKQQILSRAFYGWLQYYRNIKTVKTQFSNLVQPGSVQSDVPCDASEGLTTEIWKEYKLNEEMTESEIYRLIYFGGIADSIRHEVWPRILGHYDWTTFDTSEVDSRTEINYEKSLSQWKALEVITKQRDNENVVGHIEPTLDTKPAKLMLVRQSEVTNVHPDKNGNIPDEDGVQPRKNSIINVSNCDLTPSCGFYSSDNSIDTGASSKNQDIAFKEEELSSMADNMHRIDKDVDRCDRNHPYFSSHSKNKLKGNSNLRKLRNIMITWVWEHIEIGYVQGMCDLLAPLLVVLDNESLTHATFTRLMDTMIYNFPQMSSRMDDNLSMMALLLQIIDGNLYDHMCPDGEVTSFYVSYRWFLLDFKRELCYSDVFCVWETIWSARHVASNHFNLFLALSLLQYYRDIILDNNMEYTDIIKFYNEMAEKHQVQKLLYIGRGLIESIRDIVQSR